MRVLRQPGTTVTVLAILGMKDNECREIVTSALEAMQGVLEAHVSLLRGRATVWHEAQCHPADLIRAVERAAFSASVAPEGA